MWQQGYVFGSRKIFHCLPLGYNTVASSSALAQPMVCLSPCEQKKRNVPWSSNSLMSLKSHSPGLAWDSRELSVLHNTHPGFGPWGKYNEDSKACRLTVQMATSPSLTNINSVSSDRGQICDIRDENIEIFLHQIP
jgi:hypothetical protein